MKAHPHTLAQLGTGDCATIERVDAADPQVLRLMTLGLVEGVTVRMVGAAIGGDPIELQMFGRGISLRREQALRFQVRLHA